MGIAYPQAWRVLNSRVQRLCFKKTKQFHLLQNICTHLCNKANNSNKNVIRCIRNEINYLFYLHFTQHLLALVNGNLNRILLNLQRLFLCNLQSVAKATISLLERIWYAFMKGIRRTKS